MHAQQIEEAVIRLKQLPPERAAEVADFIEFLSQRERDQSLTQAAQAISEPALAALWDNPDDAEYDRL